MADKVTYHLPDGRAPWVLTVLKRNADGTLDLAGEDGHLKVGKCPVAQEPTVGHATLNGIANQEGADSGSEPSDAILVTKTKKELLAIIEQLNSDPKRTEKIVVRDNATKDDILLAINAALKNGPAS